MKKAAIVFAAFLALSLSAAFRAAAQAPAGEKIVVSAASSLTDVLTALKPEAEKRIGAEILLNFGASGTLRKQIEEGAPADVFFSAASSDMDSLEKAGLLAPGTRRDLLSNAIVLVGDKTVGPPKDVQALRAVLESAKLLAIGNPDLVPAGRYAVQALKSLGLYPIVEKKLVLGGNVREVLQYVESGSAPLGIVFLTDAMTLKAASPAGKLYQFPEDALATPVFYPIAAIAASKAKDKAAAYIDFLSSAAARDAFSKAGFVVR
jgi:molybdate transport system substrate-binding protein